MNGRARLWLLSLSASAAIFGGALFACRKASTPRAGGAPKPDALDVPVARAAAEDASVVVDPRALGSEPQTLGFLADGSLAIATRDEVLVVDPAGAIRRAPIPKDTYARISPQDTNEGVVLEGKTEAVLLSTPSLTPLFSGRARPLPESPGALAIEGTTSTILLQVGGKLARWTLPPSKGGPERVGSIAFTRDRSLAVVTWSTDDRDHHATIFDAKTGARVGAAHPMRLYELHPKAALHDTTQLAIEGSTLVFRDLRTAKVTKRKPIPCRLDKGSTAELFFANPMMSPDGSLVLLTCGFDGVALDGRTLAVERRYPNIVPGCDNGMFLPAHFDPAAPHMLVIEGCGGEARLDLSTGKYACGDSDGVLGGRYAVAPGQNVPRAPAARRSLPRCAPGEPFFREALGASGRFHVLSSDPVRVEWPNGGLDLERDALSPILSPDEARIAYVRRGRVVVRAVPKGDVLLELVYR